MTNLLKTPVILAALFSLAGCSQPEKPDWAEINQRYQNQILDDYQYEHYTVPDIVSIRVLNETEYAIEKGELQRLKADRDALLEKYRLAQEQGMAATEANNENVKALIECQYGKEIREETIRYQEDQAYREQIINIGKQVVLAGVCGLLLQ